MQRRRLNILCRTVVVAVLFAGLLLLAAKPVVTQAAESRFGNVIFTPPAGWTRLQQAQALLFIAPQATKQDAAVLAILRGQVLSGLTFHAWFDAAVRASLSKGDRILNARDKDTVVRGNPYEALYTMKVVQAANGTRSYRFFLGAHPGNRAELIVYYATSQKAFAQSVPALKLFIASVHFANVAQQGTTSAPPPTATPAATPIPTPDTSGSSGSSGADVTIYSGQKTSFNFVPNFGAPGGGNYQYQTHTYFYTFLPGSRVYYGLPPANSLPTACASTNDSCGSYTTQDGALHISWDNGNSEQLSVLNGGASLQTGNLTLYRVNPADQGLRGSYGYSTYVDTSGAGGSGNVSGDHSITFNGDGTFSANNFVGSINAGNAAGDTTSSQGSRSGNYSINGYVLKLTYDDGTTEQHILFLYGDGSLAIDGTTYSPRS